MVLPHGGMVYYRLGAATWMHVFTLLFIMMQDAHIVSNVKRKVYSHPLTDIQNRIHINKTKIEIQKIKCKVFYWHLINNNFHKPKAISSCGNTYINFKNKDESFWKIISKMPFICSRHTIIETFQ